MQQNKSDSLSTDPLYLKNPLGHPRFDGDPGLGAGRAAPSRPPGRPRPAPAQVRRAPGGGRPPARGPASGLAPRAGAAAKRKNEKKKAEKRPKFRLPVCARRARGLCSNR